MPAPSTIALFAVAALVLLLIPGPGVLYIIARSIGQGRRAGLVSALGVGVGNFVQVIAATLGLSALLLSSALAFNAVKYAGAAYLVYLGVRTLLTRTGAHAVAAPAPVSLPRIFRQGVIVNMLNPKVALFFIAFLPQFIEPERGAASAQIFFLGTLFVLMGICSDSLYALLARAVGGALRGSTRFRRAERYVTGGIYIGLGVATAATGVDRK